MKRNVLVVPLYELKKHLQENSRQDIKIIAPDILTGELFKKLKAKGKEVKPEQHLDGDYWKHSGPLSPNHLSESGEFIGQWLPQYVDGPFAVSFANDKAEQDAHYHKHHWEIYYSEHPIGAEYRLLGELQRQPIRLQSGGMIVFGAEVIHKMQLGGLTIVIEVPSVANDKVNEEL